MGGRRAAILMAMALCPPVLAACGRGPAELVWHQEAGYRWARVSPGRLGGTGFELLGPSRTGVTFENRLSEEEIAADRNTMNGSGVAAGDVDGDGWTDLYFAGLGGSDRLYRNRGAFEFEDVTASAGLASAGRSSTGVVLADVDGDGDLDLLVASLHQGVSLYANDGTGRFAPVAEAGLGSTAHKGNTTLALADIDRDGDLDLYVTNYRERNVNDLMEAGELTWEKTVEGEYRPGSRDYALRAPFDRYYTIVEREGMVPERREVGEPDQLFLNDGAGRFREVEDPPARFLDAEGRPEGPGRGWGLSARFHDVNGDGLVDLWVCNDFWTPDHLWLNQGGGIFREAGPLAIRNLSFSSMAVDFSDIDRDGSVDILATEMLATDQESRLRQYVPEGPRPDIRLRSDARPQYNRNSLYVGRGDGTWAETSWYSGLQASGWSWGTRFLDVDLDGYEDVLVNNGFAYDLQDLDTQLRVNQAIARGARSSLGNLTEYPPLPLVDRAFRNHGDLTFSDVSADWGFREADIAQGLATADLDHDGDLDLVVSRLNDPAALYENTGTAPRIAVRLLGRAPNTGSVGAGLTLEGGPVTQTKQVVSGGGYLSGSDPLTVFAAGEGEHTLTVRWPDGTGTTVTGVRPNRIYEVRQPEREAGARGEGAGGRAPPGAGAGAAGGGSGGSPEPGDAALFEDVSVRIGYTHHEDPFDDFALQPLLPVMLSHQGPGVSWIDLDRDGDEDLVVAAGRGGRTGIFENRGDGTFAPRGRGEPAGAARSDVLGGLTAVAAGDQTTILGWAEGAGTTVVTGSANLEQGDVGAPAALTYRIVGADATGTGALPDNRSTTGPLAAADVDGDGDLDLFVGGRFVPARYPAPATSRLFRNRDGELLPDEENAGVLADVGLVSGAVFTDYDGDGDPDLLLAREWDTLLLLRNDEGRFEDVSEAAGLSALRGWWQGVATGDFDGDGRPDLVATNWGLNSPYRPVPGHPLRMVYGDFNWDGGVDIVEALWDRDAGGYVPRRQLQAFQSIPSTVMQSVESHADFARSTVDDILGVAAGTALRREVDVLESTVFLNRGGRFEARPLPREAQLSIAFAAAVGDVDNDGAEDLFLSQNLFSVRRDLPRLDAGRGLWLKGDGAGGFRARTGRESGVEVYGEQRGAALADFDGDGRIDLAVAQNRGALRLFRNRTGRTGLRVRLQGPPGNRDGIGSTLRVVYDDGTRGPAREIQAGSGYWSQNGAAQVLGTAPGKAVRAIEVTWFDGVGQSVAVEEGRSAYVVMHPG